MPIEQRKLAPSFISHLNTRGLFPGREELRTWCSQNGRKGFANKFHGPLQSGDAVPRSLIDLLVTYCVQARTPAGTAPHADALLAYCRALGFESIELRYHVELVELVSTPASPLGQQPLDNASAFAMVLAQNAHVAHQTFREAQDEHLTQVIEWFAVEYARQLADGPLRYDEACRLGLLHRGTSINEYMACLRSWRRVSPLVLGLAMAGPTPIGATLAIPLREAAYHRVRSGRVNTRDLGPEDLSETSCFLFLEAIVMEPHATKARQKEPTELLVTSFFAQMALLSRVPGIAQDPPLHLISAAFSPFARHRLAGLGCNVIGTRHAGTEQELMERVVDIRRANSQDAALWGNWRSLQRQLSVARGE